MNEYQNHTAGQSNFNQPSGAGNTSGSLITPELLHSFVVEVKGYLPRLESGITDFFRQPASMERLAEAHGYAHTIRKAAQVIGMTPLANIAERLQSLLEKLAIGGLPLDAPTYYGFQQIIAQVGIYLDHSAVGGAVPPTGLVEAIYALENYTEIGYAPAPVEAVAPVAAPELISPPQIYVLSEQYGETSEASPVEEAPQYYPEPTIHARNSGRLTVTPALVEADEAQPVKADLPPVYVLTPQYDAAQPVAPAAVIETQPATEPMVEPIAVEPIAVAPLAVAPMIESAPPIAVTPEWWTQEYVQEAAQVSPHAITSHLAPLPTEAVTEAASSLVEAAVEAPAYVWPQEPAVAPQAAAAWPPADWTTYDEVKYENAAAVEVPAEAFNVAGVPHAFVTIPADALNEELRKTAELPVIRWQAGSFADSADEFIALEALPVPPPPPAPPIYPSTYPPVFKTASVFEEAAPYWQVVSPWSAVSEDETPTQELPSALPVEPIAIEPVAVELTAEPIVIHELPIEPIFTDESFVFGAYAPEARASSRLAERLVETATPEALEVPEAPEAADNAAFWMSASGSLSALSPHQRSDWAARYAQPEARSEMVEASSPIELPVIESPVIEMAEIVSPIVPSEELITPAIPLAVIEPQLAAAPSTAGAAETFISWEGEERTRTSFDAKTVWGARPSAALELPETLPLAVGSAARDPFAALLDQLIPNSDNLRIASAIEPASVAPTVQAIAPASFEAAFAAPRPEPWAQDVFADDFLDLEEEVASPAPAAAFSGTGSSADWDVPAELLEVFLPEAEEHLTVITTSLPKLAAHPDNKALLQEIRRSSHSLKGSSAVVGFLGITKLAHRMEDLLDLLYDGELTLTSEMLDLLFSSTEALDNLLNSKSEPELIGSLYATYDRLLAGHAEAETSSYQREAQREAEREFEAEERELEAAAQAEAEAQAQAEAEDLAVFVAPNFATAKALNSFPSLTASLNASLNESLAQRALDMVAESGELIASATKQVAQETALASLIPEALPGLPAAAPMIQAPVAAAAQEDAKDSSQSVISRGNYVRVPIERLDSVVKLVTELIVNRATLEQNMGQFVRQLEELRGNALRLNRVANRMEVQYEASTLGSGLQSVKAGKVGSSVFTNALPNGNQSTGQGLTAKLASPVVSSNNYGFDALEFDRYTEFHLLLRELTECAGDMQTMEREMRTIREYFESALNRQGRLNSEMQDQLMRLRMLPLASLSSRLHRTAHQVAQQSNKQVNFILEGEDTRLDKTVIEEMTDPLLHILRNAVDHGIEPAGTRLAQGKAPQGTIRLRAYHEGTQTVIQITDDGAGLHPERLRAKAISTGMVSAADAVKLTDDELFALIFLPGFSTATEISEISGRGVGMDIVKTTIQRLKGRIDLESKVGKGTTFTIRLPMTLAVMRALLVKSHQQTFAIPPVGLQQIVKLTPDMLDRVGEQQVIRINNKIFPLLQLGRLLNLKRSAAKPEGAQLALIMSLEDRHFAIAVDETVGGRDVVVKNLGNHIREVRGITGTTLMGDGSAVLILNLPELIRDSLRPASAQTGGMTKQQAAIQRPRVRPPVEQRGPLNIMVIDDSLSVRRVLANRMNAVGWKPIQAKDGLDALEQLQHAPRLPDLILLDIEMPRMDGYEFLSALRKNPDYAAIPVVMITSRAGQKHRDRAFEAGANEYLIKPYQDEQLLSLIRRLAQVAE